MAPIGPRGGTLWGGGVAPHLYFCKPKACGGSRGGVAPPGIRGATLFLGYTPLRGVGSKGGGGHIGATHDTLTEISLKK